MQKMPLGEHVRRYVLFFTSVLMQGLGIALITLAHIGTTPISSTNFVISLHTPLTLGDTTMIFNVLLVILQIMIVNRKILEHWLNIVMQVPVILMFSWMIDFAMSNIEILLPEVLPYWLAWALVILGTVILAFSIACSFVASVCMVPGEYFIKVFHPLVNRSFSYVKTFFDIFLVSCAIVISLFLTGFSAVEGVREGTLFAALITGPMVHLFIPLVMHINPLLQGTQTVAKNKVQQSLDKETATVLKKEASKTKNTSEKI